MEAHDRVVEGARTLATESCKEAGCRRYEFWADLGEPGKFRVFEEWERQEALTAHFAEPHFAAFGAGLEEGDMLGMDVNRYIDPTIENIF